MWPGGAFGSRGRIAPGDTHEVGRVLVHADAPEWRETIAAAFGTGGEPATVPADLLEGCVRQMAGWSGSWSARPEVVVDLAADGRTTLVATVADHLAEVGRLQRATLPVGAAPPDPRELSSAEEAAHWRDALQPSALPHSVAGRVVLLVVDATSSLWPVTVAAAALRRAGAQAVLPLLIHRRP
jgi:ATP-dependent DNA helicase RecQ